MFNTPQPANVWFTVNRACNFRCSWCYASNTEYELQDQMSLKMACNLLDIINELGVKKINIIGGEPTLWPHLLEFNDKCRTLGINTTLVTNALRFADDNFWSLYQQSPNDSAGVSYKDCTQEGMKEHVGIKKLDKVDKGLQRAIDYFKVVPNFVYSKSVQGRIVEMVEYAIDLGASGVTVGFCTPTITEDGADSASMIDVHSMTEEVVGSYDRIHDLLNGRLVYSMKHPLCIWPLDFLEKITERGQIMTTCHVHHQSGCLFDTDGSLLMCNSLLSFPIGRYDLDFNDADSLVRHMSSEKVVSFYKKMKRYPSEKCIDCVMYSKCAGGCPLLWSALKPSDVITGFNT